MGGLLDIFCPTSSRGVASLLPLNCPVGHLLPAGEKRSAYALVNEADDVADLLHRDLGAGSRPLAAIAQDGVDMAGIVQ